MRGTTPSSARHRSMEDRVAKKIEYLNAQLSNESRDFSRDNSHNWGAYDEVDSQDINRLVHIRLDNQLLTENVSAEELWDDEVEWRWDQLSEFPPPPEEVMNLRTALCYVEAIWLDTIRANATGHSGVINAFFKKCLESECDYALDPSPWDEFVYNGKEINLDMFKEIAYEGGVEYRIEAWLSGVPLEVVLAE